MAASSTCTSTAAAITSLAAELQTSAPNSLGLAIQQQQQQQLLNSQAQPSPSVAQSQTITPNRTPTPNLNVRPPSAGGKQLPLSQKSQQVSLVFIFCLLDADLDGSCNETKNVCEEGGDKVMIKIFYEYNLARQYT